MDRKKRIAAIQNALEREAISDQTALRAALRKAGVRVSQSTLSRDLQALGAQRVRKPSGAFAYAVPPAPPAAPSEEVFRRRFLSSVKGVRRTNFVVLLFTPPGEAQLIGRLLDEADRPGIAGTVAGDDTILVVADSEKAAKRLERDFKEMIR